MIGDKGTRQMLLCANLPIDETVVLLRNSNQSDREQLLRSYETMTDGAKMGERFLFFGLLHPSRLARPKMATGLKLEKKAPAQPPVAGFTEISFA
uniref:Uncharacterized protein n=1 Tax=Hippocampus comes TaxID=109280 RepID=A0A3Q2YCS5_HIPCM